MNDLIPLKYGTQSTVSRWFANYWTEADKRALPWLFVTILLGFFFLGPKTLLALVSMLPMDQLGNSGASIRAHLALLLVAAGLVLLACTCLLARMFTPAMVELTPEGIRRVWLAGIIRLPEAVLPWSTIKAVYIGRQMSATDASLHQLCFANEQSTCKLKLTLGNLERNEKLAPMLEAISKRAPRATIAPDVFSALMPQRNSSFTEIWLDALSAPPGRERLLPLSEGMILNHRYRTIRKLGSGGQGTVFLAEDLQNREQSRDNSADQNEGENQDLDQNQDKDNGKNQDKGADGDTDKNKSHNRVVLKETILPVYADLISRKQAIEAFHKEAHALESVKHPGIVAFLGSFVEDHRAYLVLEYINGRTLDEMVSETGPLSSEQAIAFGIQMCNILSVLHSLTTPLIHRDFTPDNLLVKENGDLVLIDFAVAVAQDSGGSDVAGKAAYMAPEQFKGLPTVQSDVFSLGCTIYFLLTGQSPEPLGDCLPVLVNRDVPGNLNEIVGKATKYNLDDRYPDIQAVKAALETAATISAK